MRISSRSLQLQWLADVYRRQSEIAGLQKQLGSGKRIDTAADDPAGASRMVTLDQGLARLQNFQASAEALRRRLSLEENALDQAGNVLTRVRELAVEAGGGVLDNAGRRAIAVELRELLGNMVDIANSQDGEGRYLFAGNRVGTQPVTLANGSASYNGDDGSPALRIGEGRSMPEGDPGSAVFFAIRNGNGTFYVEADGANQGSAFFRTATVADTTAWIPDDYTITFTAPDAYTVTDGASNVVASGSWSAGDAIAFRGVSIEVDGVPSSGDRFSARPSANCDVFGMVNRLIEALETDSTGGNQRGAFQNALNATLMDLDRSETHLGAVRSSVGARLAAIDEQHSANEELTLQLETTLSSIRDVDFPRAVSELQTSLTALEAAQRVFAQTSALSLFDLL